MKIGTIRPHRQQLPSGVDRAWATYQLCDVTRSLFLWDSVPPSGNKNDNAYLTGSGEDQIKTHGCEVPASFSARVWILLLHTSQGCVLQEEFKWPCSWNTLILLDIWPRISETIPRVLFCLALFLNRLMLVQACILIKKPITATIRNLNARRSCYFPGALSLSDTRLRSSGHFWNVDLNHTRPCIAQLVPNLVLTTFFLKWWLFYFFIFVITFLKVKSLCVSQPDVLWLSVYVWVCVTVCAITVCALKKQFYSRPAASRIFLLISPHLYPALAVLC